MTAAFGEQGGLKVAVITRLTMQNAGNEGLSAELAKLVSEHPRVAQARMMDRHPRYFQNLTLGALKRKGDVVAAFDALADRLISQVAPDPSGPLTEAASPDRVRLDPSGEEPALAVRRLKRAIGVRRNLARFGLIGREDLRRRLNTLAWADLVIWNPAGELHPTGGEDEPMRLLLMVRIAQKLGARTAIVNHSLEIVPALEPLIAHVYRAADHVGVRDARSVEVARSIGVAAERLFEAPDLVFNAGASPPLPVAEPLPQGAVALAINGLQALSGHDEWPRLMERLQALGRPLVFLSNSTNHDSAFAARLRAMAPLTITEGQPSYRALRTLYGDCACVVSSRLHACVLALAAGTPVVSLEPSVFKLTAVFEQLGYRYPTDDLQQAGWADRVADRIDDAIARGEPVRSETLQAVERQREAIARAYAPLFEKPPA